MGSDFGASSGFAAGVLTTASDFGVSSGFAAGGVMLSCFWMCGVVFAGVCDLFDFSLILDMLPITRRIIKTKITTPPTLQPLADFLFAGGGIGGREGNEMLLSVEAVDCL